MMKLMTSNFSGADAINEYIGVDDDEVDGRVLFHALMLLMNTLEWMMMKLMTSIVSGADSINEYIGVDDDEVDGRVLFHALMLLMNTLEWMMDEVDDEYCFTR